MGDDQVPQFSDSVKEFDMYRFNVNGMTSGHCTSAVEKAIKSIDPQAEISTDIEHAEVTVRSQGNEAASEVDASALLFPATLRAIGFNPDSPEARGIKFSLTLRRSFHYAIPGQTADNRAVRPSVALAVFRQVLECTAHFLEFARLELKLRDMLKRKTFDVGARTTPVAPERNQFIHLRHRKPEIPCAPDEAQGLHILVRVIPVSSFS